MTALFSSLASVGAIIAQLDLDISGFLVGREMMTLLASLFTTVFAGLANALIGNLFAGG